MFSSIQLYNIRKKNDQCSVLCADQCAAMAKAMKTSMQGTKHRWCRWHVLKNAKDRLGKVYSKHKRFKHDFNKLITDETNIPAFEKKWCELVKKYKLVKNKFLKRLFKHREKWAKPYFMGIFCAGMTITQRSESANHMLKNILSPACTLHQFLKQYMKMQYIWDEDENYEERHNKLVS